MKYGIFISFLIFFIRVYQYTLSPLKTLFTLGMGCCRYHPTCSQYAIQALKKYGFFRGITLAVKRILRCHPWGGHGHDPLP